MVSQMEIIILYNQNCVLNFVVSFVLGERNGPVFKCDTCNIEFSAPKHFLAHLSREHKSELVKNDTYKILRRLSHRIDKEFKK